MDNPPFPMGTTAPSERADDANDATLNRLAAEHQALLEVASEAVAA